MKQKLRFVFASIALCSMAAFAAETAPETASRDVDLVDYVVQSCQYELEMFCAKVKPGDGRLVACFYAHGDKISGRCEYALFNAAAELEQFVAAMAHIASQCRSDLVDHCGEVESGEGRLASCLLSHREALTPECIKAIDETGLEVVD